MNSETDSHKAANIASHIKHLKEEILARWRQEVRRDPEQAALIHKLDDQELQDHLPRAYITGTRPSLSIAKDRAGSRRYEQLSERPTTS
jgi:hypothetical protein